MALNDYIQYKDGHLYCKQNIWGYKVGDRMDMELAGRLHVRKLCRYYPAEELVWEMFYGPLFKYTKVQFLDGNECNIDPSNLTLIPDLDNPHILGKYITYVEFDCKTICVGFHVTKKEKLKQCDLAVGQFMRYKQELDHANSK